MDEAIQNGWVGALIAKKRFNVARGIKFSTFAYKYIVGAIMNARIEPNVGGTIEWLAYDPLDYTLEYLTMINNASTLMSKIDLDLLKARIGYDYYNTELAEVLGVSRQAIEQRVNRNVQKLKEFYNER